MSDESLSRRALDLFDEVLELPEQERDRWIEAHSAQDPALVDELRALLAAAARVTGVLELSPSMVTPQELRESLAAALSDKYEIGSELGRGGMAAVFRARERKHDRDVVIKVLDPNTAHYFGAERFLREVSIAATLAHPHIVPLIDSGAAEGLLYYVMPFMNGETLRDRLRRTEVSTPEAIGILRDVAGALAFAHDGGVVHRDIKPENVFLTAGHAYLLDFGIAKIFGDPSADITSPGIALGTQRYMAPEQAMAADDVDGRVDMFAWGLLGIEMLTGKSVVSSEAENTAPAALARRRDLPGKVATLLLECVSEAVARRPFDMASVLQRLDSAIPVAQNKPARKRGLLLAVGAIAAAIAVFLTRASFAAGDQFAEPIALTVLQNETGDSTLSVVGRFAGDWVTEGLQRMGGVQVVPWADARLASEHATTLGAPMVATVHSEVGAGTVVTGTYYQRRDSLYLQAQLVNARSGRVLSALAPIVFAASNPEDGISQLRDRVMGAVAATRDERVANLPGVAHTPPSFSAYRLFDAGLDQFLAQRYMEALPIFREAFARDSTFTAALLLGARAAFNDDNLAVADTLIRQARARENEMSTYQDESLRYIEMLMSGEGEKARAAIQRAADLVPNSRAGYDNAAALLNAGYAQAALDQLKRMNPDRGEMMGWSSYWTQMAHAEHMLNNFDGERKAAREMARRYPDRRVALVLEARAMAAAGDLRLLDSAFVKWESLPADVYWSQGAAMIVAAEQLIVHGREADGRKYAERAVSWFSNRLVASPNDRGHRYWLGSALYTLGRYEEARVHFEALASEFPDRLRYRGLAALTAARRGDTTAAKNWLGRAEPRYHGEFLEYQARIASISGNTERAIALLTNAVECGIEAYPWVPGAAYSDFRPIMASPRARALLSAR
ncbi:MAG: protein kinase [Gemmatimonadaceae bacterium]